MYTVDDCKIIELPIVHDVSGNITAVENKLNLPFEVKRVYYLYDIPAESERGGHSHHDLQQYIIAASGSFNFILDDGKKRKEFFLNHPSKALHILPGIWREMNNFSSGAICLVLASHEYNEKDYIRNYNDYLMNI